MPEIESLLRRARTIAVIGLSARPSRPSYGVSAAMRRYGYRVIPVNPEVSEVLGEPAVASLDELPRALRRGTQVDIVNVFRSSEHVAQIVDDCIRLGLPALWLQDGVIDEEAALRAKSAGIFTVMNRCIHHDRAALDVV
jgi:predicted CoA-binding protein